MAQKKVILKDGSNDLLPKTLASMVFTEAGQTVEEALQNAGGGSSSGGGTGNVNVTNGSSLQKNAYYAFQPSAAGSLTGKFATLPYASSEAAGLMSSNDYRKLGAIKEERELPSSVVSLSSSSAELDVAKAMVELIGGKDSGTIEGLDDNTRNFVALYWGVYVQRYTGDTADTVFTYNHSRISLVPTYTPPASGEGDQYQKASLELTYVSGGKLRTVSLTATLNASGDTATYNFKAKVEESGDDTYYLPSNVMILKSGATKAEIDEAFGGEGKFKEALTAGINKKKTYIYDAHLGIIPVSSWSISAVLGRISFMFDMTGNDGPLVKSTDGSNVSVIYLKGYPLKPALYSLTTSSSSDTISSAVGGESGLKEIIQAVKDGNRLAIREAYSSGSPITSSTEVISVGYAEGENGDLQLLLSYWVYLGIGATHNVITIAYTKSSNTFAVSAQEAIR